jgi:hypothetical protein
MPDIVRANTYLMADATTTPEKTIEIRYNIPQDAHKIISKKKRKLSIEEDRDVTMEEACIALLLAAAAAESNS